MSDSGAQSHWIPERLVRGPQETRCRWIDIGDVRYSEPFFDMTLARRRRDRPAQSISSLQEVYDRAAETSSVEPSAFFFHVSRCGSTLFCQLLCLDERAIVLSEPPILDEVLRSGLSDRERLFVATLRLLCRHRFGAERKAFIKTDCWHLFDAATLRRLYPHTPFVLLYRSPEAVLASHRRARGMQMVPGLVTGTSASIDYDPECHTLDQYAGSVLERLYHAMLEIALSDSNCLLVSYDERFPGAFLRTAERLGLDFGEESLGRIRERCGYHAKTPQETFRKEELPAVTGVDLAFLRSLYGRLEEQRRSQCGRDHAADL